ncbi:M48 family metalloprotease [Tropicibacter naphthalenivorans]|uniref:TPR repeat-containing protein YfgC n=1 Tax=Tropicibacter naphthalenivorans TaxID=441103 RepID=A0A0P1G7H4_9RHOB|nr:M48 family metalloprotease [Tropicibacter naphthalenivorans]CUH77612.1 TPR repeat-containing protein YfgC precursor [Tropicibacter naphthalenivorans]SMC54951.1 Putative Zn-dependent protease, contains TPR repeats [Tropicibacter naphthalenivorans]
MTPTRMMAFVMAAMLIFAQPVQAGVRLLRDADIEYALGQLAKPILTAAGLNASRIKVVVIDDPSLNAFVIDHRHIFIHSGLIMKLDSAPEIQAVIAHEAAHIANGHISRRLSNMRTAQSAATLGLALAAAAGAASGNAKATAGLAIGAGSSAMRLFLSHTRAEESAADMSSVRYLSRAGINPQGAVEVQDLFRGQEALSSARQDPYMRSHPLSRDRLRALKGLVAAAPSHPPNAAANYWYARARGKLTAFKRAPSWTLRRLKDSGSQDIALMREAVAYHRQSNLKKALTAIDGALALRKGDPFLMELKGQILLESRQFGAAVQVYQSAAKAAPREALILGGLGRAYLAAGQPKQALGALEAARGRDYTDIRVQRDLAIAYAKLNQPAMASLATAERFALQGRLEDAALHAKRAADRLPSGSAPWQRAQDVLFAAKQAKRR